AIHAGARRTPNRRQLGDGIPRHRVFCDVHPAAVRDLAIGMSAACEHDKPAREVVWRPASLGRRSGEVLEVTLVIDVGAHEVGGRACRSGKLCQLYAIDLETDTSAAAHG